MTTKGRSQKVNQRLSLIYILNCVMRHGGSLWSFVIFCCDLAAISHKKRRCSRRGPRQQSSCRALWTTARIFRRRRRQKSERIQLFPPPAENFTLKGDIFKKYGTENSGKKYSESAAECKLNVETATMENS